jgi:SnoaL-like protein
MPEMKHRFVEAFESAWSRPTPERLIALLDPEVVLLQPHLPPIRGRDAALKEFRRLLTWLPALHGAVERSSVSDLDVFIEWRIRLPVRNETISIPAVDRFRLRDGVAVERRVYFDQFALIGAVLRHPPLWPGWVRYRFGS